MKYKTSVSLTKEALYLLALLARKNGISKTAMLEIMIREKAKAEGISSNAMDNSAEAQTR